MANRTIDEKNEPVRASVSFPNDDYKYLESIAKERKVSVAWVVREAVCKYLEREKDSKKEKKVLKND